MGRNIFLSVWVDTEIDVLNRISGGKDISKTELFINDVRMPS